MELKASYSGAMLERYLSGKRVSLAGAGVFSTDESQRITATYLPDEPLIISWDFNVEYRAVSLWQEVGKTDSAYPIVHCIANYQMKEATVYDDALKLCEMLKEHKGYFFLIGDASGTNRTALTTGSMWHAVKKAFFDTYTERVYYRVPSVNPNIKDTVQAVNWALINGLLFFDRENAKGVYQSLTAAKNDKYGEIDKSQDYTSSPVKSHETDTARYAGWYFFQHLFPGRRSYI